MINTKTLLLFLFIAVTPTASAQKVTKAGDTLDRRLDSIFSSYNATTPGLAVSVIRDGKVVARRAYGMASLEYRVPFSHHSMVRLPYSEGREFISIAAAMMDMEGVLSFNDKVRKYFPELPEWSEPVTIYDLLNHRSGFVDEWATLLLSQASMANRFDKSQFLDLLYRQPRPEVEPTKGYMYSNSDFGLLRLILDKVTGQDLGGWMKRRMFEPLGMKKTLLHDDKELVIEGLSHNYFVYGSGYRKWTRDKTSPGGNYYIATTAADLEQWALAHADPGSVISKARERLFIRPQLMPGGKRDYVFGYKIKELGGYEVFTHQGVNRFTYLSTVKEKGLSVVTLNNSFGEGSNYHQLILSHLLGIKTEVKMNKAFTKAPVSYTTDELEQYTGLYLDADTVTFESFNHRRTEYFELVIINDSLKMKYGDDIIPLEYISPGVFKDAEYPSYIEFTKNSDGTLRARAHLHQSNRIDELVKDKAVFWQPSAQQLLSFAGKYYSPHLDSYWTISVSKGKGLLLKRSAIADTGLEPYINGGFRLRIQKFQDDLYNSEVQFHVDGNGKVTHLTVYDTRLMYHRFDRVQ